MLSSLDTVICGLVWLIYCLLWKVRARDQNQCSFQLIDSTVDTSVHVSVSLVSSGISRACLLVAGHSRIPPLGILTSWPRHVMSWFMFRLTFRCKLTFMFMFMFMFMSCHAMPCPVPSRPVPSRPSSPVRHHIKRRKIASVSATSLRVYSPRVTYQLTGLQGWHGPFL